MPVLFPTNPKKCGCPSYEWFSRWHAVIIFKQGHEPPFFFRGGPSKTNKKNADVDRVIGFFPNPSYGKWWLGNPPTKSCRPVPLMKKTYRWKILALQNTIKVHFEVHWGTLPRCHLKVASPWVDGSCGSVFFFFLVRLFGTKNEG